MWEKSFIDEMTKTAIPGGSDVDSYAHTGILTEIYKRIRQEKVTDNLTMDPCVPKVVRIGDHMNGGESQL